MKTKSAKAFTIIETIGVFTAIAALAGAILYPLIRQLDRLAREKETAMLKNMAQAYKQRALITKVIPSQAGWAAAVATQLGVDVGVVTHNDRGIARVFLIDPLLQIGKDNLSPVLPYTQTVSGHGIVNGSGVVQRPISPRLMIVSSLATPLPASLVSGVPTSTVFNGIWNAAEGTIPAGWTWSGRGDDLKIERIDLSNLFVPVILNNRDTEAVTGFIPKYSIDGSAKTDVPFLGLNVKYFLRSSELKLYTADQAKGYPLEYSEILSQAQSFTFEFGTWLSESYTSKSVTPTSAIDLQRAMDLFMAAPPNTNANAGATQLAVSNAMVAFLTNYIAWRDGTPSYDGQAKNKPPTALDTAQKNLSSITYDLIDGQ